MLPAPSELVECGTCHQLILWTTTASGKRLPVNARPDPKGNQACYRVAPREWRSRSLDSYEAAEPARWEHVFMPHPATCSPTPPSPSRPRRPRRKTPIGAAS